MASRRRIYDRVVFHRFSGGEQRQLIRRLGELLSSAPRVGSRLQLAILYGSLLRRRIVRDIDIAVAAAPPLTFQELLHLGNHLELALALPIDLAPLHVLPPKLRLLILRQGVPLLTRNPQLRHLLTAQAYSELYDFALAIQRNNSISATA